MSELTHSERPQRWDVPFDEDMTLADVDQVLAAKPFCDIDQSRFPQAIPLRGIIENEARILKYRAGDLVVRQGDYGNSAFFVIKGRVRVVVPLPNNELPESVLGRKLSKSKSVWESIAQVWKNPVVAEFRAKVQASSGQGEGDVLARGEGENTTVFLQDIPGVIKNHETVTIAQGEFFGEIAALGRTPRTATIFADEDGTELLEIKWQGLRDIRLFTPSIKQHIDKLYRQRSLNVQLGATAIFAHLNEAELQQVANRTEFHSIGSFDWHASYKKISQKSAAERLDDESLIYEEGGYPDSLVIIRAGFARVSVLKGNGHRTVGYISKGQSFGFREIAHNWRSEEPVTYQHSLRALGYVDILVVPSDIIQQYVLEKMSPTDLPAQFEMEEDQPGIDENMDAVALSSEHLSKTDVIEFMVENRYINGTATMIVDLDRCTRCDDCVRACASAHGNNPRFVRQGKHISNLMVAHACMHCQDPVCMIGCPTGAIHRQTGEGQVVINDLTCIGCSTCANSCPYENIRMVEVRSEQGAYIRDQDSQKPIVKATKCDLCAEQIGGPACQNACPHGALVRLDMKNPERLMDWISQ
ncbi:MAG: cyclic nucleotide-binding domain-containing protein [Mariprofundus sp.]|nr:cyclic nucleotide-binding domain-containing protein [Mariprofundus sp.]